MQKFETINFARLLGFNIGSDEIGENLFQDAAVSSKLGAKVGAEPTNSSY